MIEFVFYDLDGVLINSENMHYECWKVVLNDIGVKLSKNDYHYLKGKSTNEIASSMIETNNIKLTKEKLMLLKRKAFIKKIPLIKTNNSILEVIEYCNIENIKMGVVTASTKFNAVAILENNNILEKFEFIIAREDSIRNKPFPDLYIKGLQLASVNPVNSIAIEDSITGYLAATSANIPCIFFNENPHLIGIGDKHIMTSYCSNQIINYIRNKNEQ